MQRWRRPREAAGCFGVEVDEATVPALGCGDDHVGSDRGSGLADVGTLVGEIDVVPAQRCDLAASHSGEGGKVPGCFEVFSVDCCEEQAELVGMRVGMDQLSTDGDRWLPLVTVVTVDRAERRKPRAPYAETVRPLLIEVVAVRWEARTPGSWPWPAQRPTSRGPCPSTSCAEPGSRREPPARGSKRRTPATPG